MHNQVNSKEQVKYTGESKLHGTGKIYTKSKRQLVVSWCITPSQPVSLYQGDVNDKGQVKNTQESKRQRTGKIYTRK